MATRRVFSTTAPPLTHTPGVEALGITPRGSDGRVAPPDARRPGHSGAGSAAGAGAALGPIPGRWVRFGMWIVAVPLAFIVVFGLAKAFGLLTTNEITDVALAEGWHRFVPIARLVPFVALVTAAIVHGGAYGIARVRAGRSPGSSSRLPGPPAPRIEFGVARIAQRVGFESVRRPRQSSTDGR